MRACQGIRPNTATEQRDACYRRAKTGNETHISFPSFQFRLSLSLSASRCVYRSLTLICLSCSLALSASLTHSVSFGTLIPFHSPPAPVSSLTLSLLLPFTSKQSDVAASMFLNECGCSWILWCNTGIISPSFHCNSEKQTITPSSPSSPLPSSYATLGDADWGSLPSRVLKKLTVLLFWNQDKFICVCVMHRYVKAITESQQVYFYLSVNIYTGRIPNLEWAHMYVWGSHWQTCRHVKVENVGTDSMEKRKAKYSTRGRRERKREYYSHFTALYY